MMAGRETMPILGGVLLKAIPWEVISLHEKQAGHNHGQTLERLIERGGLSSSEALAIIQDKPWPGGASPEVQSACERALIRLIVMKRHDGDNRAGNAHDELVEAAKEASSFLMGKARRDPQEREIVEGLRAALAKAKP